MRLRELITSPDPVIRNRSLESWTSQASPEQLLDECRDLDLFRRECSNLYERVRAVFFLYAIHRFHLPSKLPERGLGPGGGLIPFHCFEQLLNRRFAEAIDSFLAAQEREG